MQIENYMVQFTEYGEGRVEAKIFTTGGIYTGARGIQPSQALARAEAFRVLAALLGDNVPSEGSSVIAEEDERDVAVAQENKSGNGIDDVQMLKESKGKKRKK